MDTSMQEDEAPPLLVDIEGQQETDELETAMDEVSMTKVPITIVTGVITESILFSEQLANWSEATLGLVRQRF